MEGFRFIRNRMGGKQIMVHELKITIDSDSKTTLSEMKETMLEALGNTFKSALYDPSIRVHASLISYDKEAGWEESENHKMQNLSEINNYGKTF